MFGIYLLIVKDRVRYSCGVDGFTCSFYFDL